MKKCTGAVLYERNKKAQYIVYNITILTREGGVNSYTCNYSAISETAGVYDILFIDKQNNTIEKEMYCTK